MVYCSYVGNAKQVPLEMAGGNLNLELDEAGPGA